MSSKKKVWVGRVSDGRDPITGRQRLHWIGRYPTKRERDDAVARARIERPWQRGKRMSEQEREDRICVTMTRSAAVAASDALTRAYCRMTPDMYPPASEGDRKDFETTDWLRWLISRIEVGCREAPLGEARREESA